MAKLSVALLVAPSLLATPPLPATQLAPNASKSLSLRVYDHVQIHPDIQHRAQKQTSRIFKELGIEISWLNCRTSAQRLLANPECQAALGPADFLVRILPDSISKNYGLPKAVFGFSLPINKGRLGRTVNVFYGRVFDMAFYGPVGGGFEAAQGIILGHVLAHEIGHIMLGPGSHSEKGIMSFPWGRKQLVDASRRRLRFTPQQTKKILSQLDELFSAGGQEKTEPRR